MVSSAFIRLYDQSCLNKIFLMLLHAPYSSYSLPIVDKERKVAFVVALKYMSEDWKPIPILVLDKVDENTNTSQCGNNGLSHLFQISIKLFKVLLICNEVKFGIESITNVTRCINKLISRNNSFGEIEGSRNESSYWAKLIESFDGGDELIEHNSFTYDGHSITFEMSCVNMIIQLIHRHASNGEFLKEAIELSFNLVNTYLRRVEVNITFKV